MAASVRRREAVDYEVEAFNPASASENRIHADDVARQYGFRGGLVPGVTVYGYLCHPIVRALGEQWLDRGTARVRLVAPCYEGERVLASVTPSTHVDTVDLRASVGTRVSATGTATLPAAPRSVTAGEAIPAAKPPEANQRPPASEETLAPGRVLGSIGLATDRSSADAYLGMIGEPLAIYHESATVHPGLLIQGANWVLVVNVVLPAWVHVETEMWHRRRVSVGESVEVRARVSERFVRKGHHFVALDVAWLVGEGVVAGARHVAIWRLAPPAGPS